MDNNKTVPPGAKWNDVMTGKDWRDVKPFFDAPIARRAKGASMTADKPDLPALPECWTWKGFPNLTTEQGKYLADLEAWARADERRKARAELIAEVEDHIAKGTIIAGLPARLRATPKE